MQSRDLFVPLTCTLERGKGKKKRSKAAEFHTHMGTLPFLFSKSHPLAEQVILGILILTKPTFPAYLIATRRGVPPAAPLAPDPFSLAAPRVFQRGSGVTTPGEAGAFVSSYSSGSSSPSGLPERFGRSPRSYF